MTYSFKHVKHDIFIQICMCANVIPEIHQTRKTVPTSPEVVKLTEIPTIIDPVALLQITLALRGQ
jgi:hypothetical protein